MPRHHLHPAMEKRDPGNYYEVRTAEVFADEGRAARAWRKAMKKGRATLALIDHKTGKDLAQQTLGPKPRR